MGDAWLDKLEEVAQLLDEITIDVQEKERLSHQGASTDRIATRIRRDMSRMESGVHTLSDNLSKLPLQEKERARRERMLGQIVQKLEYLDGDSKSTGVGRTGSGGSTNNNRSALMSSSSGGKNTGQGQEMDTFGQGNSEAERVLQMQQATFEEQDKGLDSLYDSVLRQKQMSQAIGDELDVQSGLLDDLEHGMDNTGTSLNRQQSRVEQLMEMSQNSGNTCIIVALTCMLIILTYLILA